jgi:hypothetical protein
MTHRGPVTTPGLTDHEILMELHHRMRVVEASCEKMAAQMFMMAAERAKLLQHHRALIEHAARLVRQKEALMEMVGRLVLESRNPPLFISGSPLELAPEMSADLERALREMGH